MVETLVFEGLAVDPSYANQQAAEWHAIAAAFRADADALGERHTAGQYVLYAHSMEMALKSYLLDNGVPEATLKKIGHNTKRLVAKARRTGMIISDPKVIAFCKLISRYVDEPLLRYKFSFSGFPSAPEASRNVQVLLDAARLKRRV